MALWVIVDDSIGLDELLAGAGAAAVGSICVAVDAHQAAIRPAFQPSWLAPALNLPARVARETVVVFAALIKRLATGAEPRSGFVAEAVCEQPDQPVVNDYVMWIVVGVACIGGVLAVAIR